MEEKESLLKTIQDVNDDETVIEEWILEENARLKYEGQMSYAREEGIQEGLQKGIEQGIEQGIEYNVPIGVDTLRRREPINCTQVEGIKSLKVDTNLWVL